MADKKKFDAKTETSKLAHLLAVFDKGKNLLPTFTGPVVNFEKILEKVTDGLTAQDASGKLIYANRAAAILCGFKTPEQLISASVEELQNRFELVNEIFETLSFGVLPGRLALAGEETEEIIIGFREKPRGALRWSAVKARPVFDNSGKVVMAINIFRDVTHEKESQLALKRALKRQDFLTQAGEILGSSLDYAITLKKVTELAIVNLSDWAAVDMLDANGELKRVAVAHKDPQKITWAFELQEKYPYNPNEPTGLAKVLRDGELEYYPQVTEEMMTMAAKDQEHLEIIKKIGFTSVLIVPLKLQSGIAGAITLVNSESNNHFSWEDVSLAQELAARAVLAIENAALYNQAKETAQNAQDQSQLIDTLLGNAPVGFSFVNQELRYIRINKFLAEINGLPAEEHIGKTVQEVLPELAETLVPLYEQVLQTNEPILNLEVSGSTPSSPGRLRHWHTSYYPVHSKDGKILGIGTVVTEITERKQAEKDIHFYAFHDSLTGLPNRKFFEQNLKTALANAGKIPGAKAAVLFLDIDRLKNINDSLGHAVGDAVINEVGVRLRQILREDDLFARWGGDEFVIFLPQIATAVDAERVAQKLLKVLEQPMRISDRSLHISLSIGIAISPTDGEDIYTLQKNADIALYRAKDSGRNRYAFYHKTLNVQGTELLVLENDLRKAISKRQLELYFQPILDIKSGQIKCVESLLRWQHPTLGLLEPNKFIPMAEESGIIVSLGEWVIRNVCRNLKKFKQDGFKLSATLNVSGRQFFEENLVSKIFEALSHYELDPKNLEIEVTESVAMENLERTKSKLTELKDSGISVIIDDFGTGYSSLNYLKRFPIDKLKIDKSFVRHCITDEQDTSIIKAIISMAKSMNLNVIAEGVDSEMQMNLLASLGCDAVQGYYIGRPLSYNNLIKFLKERAKVNK